MKDILGLPLHLAREHSAWIRPVGIAVFCLIFVSIESVITPNIAQSRIATGVLERTNIFRDIATTSCATQTATPAAAVPGSSNPEIAFNFFIAKGLTPPQAAGIVGNLMEESHVNPTVHEGGALSPPFPIANQGFGIAQWTPPGRQQGLVRFAQARGEPVTSLPLQLDYIWHELTLVPPWRNALPLIRTALTVRWTAFVFHRDFERSADTPEMITERIVAAENILARYGKSLPTLNTTPQACRDISEVGNCDIYDANDRLRVGQTRTNQAILACAALFDPYGYSFGGGHYAPREWMQWWERQGEFKNPKFRHILDASSLEMMAIYMAFGESLVFNTQTMTTMPQTFRRIPVGDARPGDLMWRPGHTEIAITSGGTRTFGAHTAEIERSRQISDAEGGKWTAAFVYIGPGSTRK